MDTWDTMVLHFIWWDVQEAAPLLSYIITLVYYFTTATLISSSWKIRPGFSEIIFIKIIWQT